MVEDLPLYIQVGRTLLNFEEKSTNIFGCCGVSENPNLLYYYRQNEKKINKVFTVKTEENINNDSVEEEEKEIEIQKEKKKKNEIEEIINI